MALPSNLQGLYRCEFEGDKLDYESTIKLLRPSTNSGSRRWGNAARIIVRECWLTKTGIDRWCHDVTMPCAMVGSATGPEAASGHKRGCSSRSKSLSTSRARSIAVVSTSRRSVVMSHLMATTLRNSAVRKTRRRRSCSNAVGSLLDVRSQSSLMVLIEDSE